MKKLDELLSKSEAEIKAEIKSKRKEKENANKNNRASVGVGILGILGGVGSGLVIGLIIGFIVEIGSCINNGTEKGMSKYSGIIVLSSMVIGGIIGYKVANSDN